MADPGQIKVLTFNTWGLPLASKDDKLRLGKQADFFRESGKTLDVVLLQEVWTDPYVNLLVGAAAEAGLSYSTTFDGGVLGAGLLVLSRLPITDVAFRPYSLRGEPGALQGEALSGKGIGYARLQLPSGRAVHVFNTHTHANWVHSVRRDSVLGDVLVPTDTFAPFRVSNILEAVAFMRPIVEAAAAAGELVFAGGDWNVPVDTLEAAVLQEMLPCLRDSWQRAGHSPLDPAGNTCGDLSNVYTGSIIGGYVPERIDFVWTNARVVACETALKVMPGTHLNYSDHFAVLVTAACQVENDTSATANGQRPVVKAEALPSPAGPAAGEGGVASPSLPLAGALACWTDGGETDPAAPGEEGDQPPRSCRRPERLSPGPVAEATKVSPDPCGGAAAATADGGDGCKATRRVRLLQLAAEQLRYGLDATARRHARLYRWAYLYGAITVMAIVAQLYCIMSATDHWAKRLVGGVAVVAAPAALLLALWRVPLLLMNTGLRRGFGQVVRMAETWERTARAEMHG